MTPLVFILLIALVCYGFALLPQRMIPGQTRNVQVQSRPSFLASTAVRMASRGSGGGGSTKLDTRIQKKTQTKPTYREEIERDWRLILHDDTVHTIQEVCDIISKNVPLCPGPRAYEVTMEVHMTGAGTVCIANKKLVEEYTTKLQMSGLTVSMAPDDDFESGDVEGDEEE